MAKIMSEGDKKVLALAWSCFETQPKVDYKKLATLGNYKNANSANAIFLLAKKRLLAGADTADTADAGGDQEASPKKRGKSADAEEGGSPKKKGRKTKAQKAAEATEAEEEEGVKEENGIKGEEEEA